MSYQTHYDYYGQEHADNTLEEDKDFYRNENYDFQATYYEHYTDDKYGQFEENENHSPPDRRDDFFDDEYYGVEYLSAQDEMEIEQALEMEEDYYYQESEYDHFYEQEYEQQELLERQEYEGEQWDQLAQEHEDWEESSYLEDWGDHQQSEFDHEYEELLHQELQEEELDQEQQQYEEFNQSQIQNHQHQMAVENEYQIQQEYEQERLQRNGLNGRRRKRRGYDHFAGLAKYSLRDHMPGMKMYRHDLRSGKQELKGQSMLTPKSSSFFQTGLKIPGGYLRQTQSPFDLSQISSSSIQIGIIFSEKMKEAISYPIQLTLELTEKIISRLIGTGYKIVSPPFRYVLSKAQDMFEQFSLRMRIKNITKNIMDLYAQGFSKPEIIHKLKLPSILIEKTLEDYYQALSKNITQQTTIQNVNAPSSGSETALQIESQEEPQSEQSAIEVEDDIEDIIRMYHQGYSVAAIAQILFLRLSFVKMILSNQYFSEGAQALKEENTLIPFDPGTKSRYVDIGMETILFPKYGQPIKVSELQQLSPEELKAVGPFLMFDEMNKPVYSHIHSTSIVTSKNALRVTSLSGIDAIVGVNTKSLADQLTGMNFQVMTEAEKVDYFVARDFSKFQSAIPSPFELLKGGKLDIFFRMEKACTNEINEKLKEKYKSMREACRILDLKYSRITDSYHKRSYTYNELLRIHQAINYPAIYSQDFLENVLSIGAGGRQKEIRNFVKPEFFYVLGLIASDGYIGEYVESGQYRIGFANKDQKLLEKFSKLILEYFPELTLGYSVNQDEVPQIHTNNYVVVRIINNLMIKGSEVEDWTAFLPIFRYSTEYIGQFLRGYFDGDGSVDVDSPRIHYTVHKKKRAQNLQLLLKRFNINSSLSNRISTGPKGISNVYGVYIYGKKDLLNFVHHIQTDHSKKSKRFELLLNYYNNKKAITTNRNRASIIVGSLIRIVRLKLNLRQKDLGKSSTISQIEKLTRRTSVDLLNDYIRQLVNKGATEDIPEFKQLKEIGIGEHILDEFSIYKPEYQLNYLLRIRVRNKLIIGNGLIIDSDNIQKLSK